MLRKRILSKISFLPLREKCKLMNSLVETFGYEYVCPIDVFSTTTDAWQKQFGYTALFDAGAERFHMIFDCEPVYFDYHGKTWLIEFWKGQYGINVGGEIGIYHSDRLLLEQEKKTEVFAVAEENEWLEMSMVLRFHEECISLVKRHWWLTIFCMGSYAEPYEIVMDISIRFPDTEMLSAFTHALTQIGYDRQELCICGTDLSFTFTRSHTQRIGVFSRIRRKIMQCKNRLLCRFFRFFTKPFESSLDRLLFLYFHLPSAFRRTLRLRRFPKKHRHKRLRRA